MFQNADEAKKFIADEDVKFVDVRFCDLPGVMQHFTVPVEAFDPDEELAFDGSSIRGFQAIHESDMALRADLSTSRVDPFRRDKTLNINFFIHDPITGEQYSRDPRNVAKKAEAYLASSGIADTAYFGPEAEFYVFDSVRFATSANESFYHIDSEAGAWNTGALENNRGYKVRYKGGYCVVGPTDQISDLRTQMVMTMQAVGIVIETHHHEVASAGQCEIDSHRGLRRPRDPPRPRGRRSSRRRGPGCADPRRPTRAPVLQRWSRDHPRRRPEQAHRPVTRNTGETNGIRSGNCSHLAWRHGATRLRSRTLQTRRALVAVKEEPNVQQLR